MSVEDYMCKLKVVRDCFRIITLQTIVSSFSLHCGLLQMPHRITKSMKIFVWF